MLIIDGQLSGDSVTVADTYSEAEANRSIQTKTALLGMTQPNVPGRLCFRLCKIFDQFNPRHAQNGFDSCRFNSATRSFREQLVLGF